MNKKILEALAKAFAASHPNKPGMATVAQWTGDLLAVADVAASFNPRFDRARFIDACRTKPKA